MLGGCMNCSCLSGVKRMDAPENMMACGQADDTHEGVAHHAFALVASIHCSGCRHHSAHRRCYLVR